MPQICLSRNPYAGFQGLPSLLLKNLSSFSEEKENEYQQMNFFAMLDDLSGESVIYLLVLDGPMVVCGDDEGEMVATAFVLGSPPNLSFCLLSVFAGSVVILQVQFWLWKKAK